RPETLTEFEAKIRNDLRASVQDIIDHGLPHPTLFAFPFSEGFNDRLESNDPQAAATALAVFREMFAGAFNNAPPRPLPAGARAAATGMAGRIELNIDSTVEELLTKVRARTPVTPAQAPPGARTDLWTRLADDDPAAMLARGDEVRLSGSGRWQDSPTGVTPPPIGRPIRHR
ncbi:MAG TPA: polysaccharide deacetylase family protein, partial [Mycobacterium sp.]|nr:polysaccharide deacetylase family protein [Mycobacterium sp.]